MAAEVIWIFFFASLPPPEWVCRAMNEPMNELALSLSHSSNTQYVSLLRLLFLRLFRGGEGERKSTRDGPSAALEVSATGAYVHFINRFFIDLFSQREGALSSRPVVINTYALKTF